MIDFVKTSTGIVAALNTRSMSMTEDDRTRYVYNNAIEDAVEFVRIMGVKNPDVRLACMRLEREMKEWLPLRMEDSNDRQQQPGSFGSEATRRGPVQAQRKRTRDRAQNRD